MVIDKCPHCGGVSGLYYEVKQEYAQYFAWDGYNRGPSEMDGDNSKTARCADCRRIVTKYAKQIRPYNIYFRSAVTYDMGDSIL